MQAEKKPNSSKDAVPCTKLFILLMISIDGTFLCRSARNLKYVSFFPQKFLNFHANRIIWKFHS